MRKICLHAGLLCSEKKNTECEQPQTLMSTAHLKHIEQTHAGKLHHWLRVISLVLLDKHSSGDYFCVFHLLTSNSLRRRFLRVRHMIKA